MKKKFKFILSNKLPLLLFLLGILSLSIAFSPKNKTDPRSASVKITNRAKNSGGTGIILNSTQSETSILTNDHVCKLVKKGGGLVLTKTGEYQVTSIIESELSDLCLLQVADDLGVNTSLSPKAPKFYDQAIVSGHPALFPNVLSYGHFSGRAIIQVNTGMRECTDKDMEDPRTGMVCAFFGGLPVVKSYESVLVTATIMPGSSGSGVYNSKNQLNGVVFAGSTQFGYAWTVPYEQVLNFLYKEHMKLPKQDISQEIDIFAKDGTEKKIQDALAKCTSVTDEVIKNYCDIIKRDMVWHE